MEHIYDNSEIEIREKILYEEVKVCTEVTRKEMSVSRL